MPTKKPVTQAKKGKAPARRMTTAKRAPKAVEILPDSVQKFLAEREAGGKLDVTLEKLLPGKSWSGVRQQLKNGGSAQYKEKDGSERVLVADFDADGKLMNVAAAIPRNAGKAQDFLNQIEDFAAVTTATRQGRIDAVDLFHRLYRNDGMTNNAINKLAALIAPEGAFKVRSVKGVRGKSGDKQAIELQTALNWWKDNVNARSETSVITGDRGITSFIVRGARLAMIEGDHISRHLWPTQAQVMPGTNLKPFSLPMNLVSYSVANVVIPDGLDGTNIELFYWKPPQRFVSLLKNPTFNGQPSPELKKMLAQIVPKDVQSQLVKNNGYYLLDPTLLIHIKNKGTGIETFGESTIEPTLSDIRYKRALDALEITTITNLINRMVIVKVGSDNEKSVYHKSEVSSSRLGLLQRAMANLSPSSIVLWGGPDIEVVEVGAHNSILELDGRWKIAERRHLMSLGLPAVLMIGEGSDGKAAGFSAALGVAAQLSELQNQYKQALRSLAERIALENGYEEVDVVWEFHDNLLEDKQAAAELILKMFDRGLASTQTALEELGFDYGAEESRQADDVGAGYKPQAFGPPLVGVQVTGGVAGDRLGGTPGSEPGRPTNSENPNLNGPDPRKGKETKAKNPNSPHNKPGA